MSEYLAIRGAAGTSGDIHDEARANVQARLALFSKLWFWLFWVTVAAIAGFYRLYPAIRPAGAGVVFDCALAGQAVFAGIWYFALHKRQLSLRWLYRIDTFYLLVIGIELGNSIYMQSKLPAAVYAGLTLQTLVVFARTVMLPSSGKRTFVVTSLSFLPLVIAVAMISIQRPEDLDLPALGTLTGGCFLGAIAVLLATTGSHVVYGLRRQVREAMQLGQYTLERKIGEGGMGSVHLARHAFLRRPTAIKLLPPDRGDPHSLKRFEREVQNMSRLTHPNTVAVFDYGRSVDGGFYYYAMEFLDGIDLETLVRLDGPQPAPRVIHVMRQICGALDEAHALGFIHRDIKPANVLLCQRGRQPDVAKVVDFGLVKEITHTSDDTGTKVIAGTPGYLAPEAITDPDTVGPASDLYALGALGYFLLTGHRVFDGKTTIHILTQHATATPVPPSQRTDRVIPADLEALILACLAKAPSSRPSSAQALRLALGALPAYREWDETAAAEWWRDFDAHRRPAAAAGVPPDSPITITRELVALDADRTDVDVDAVGDTRQVRR